MFGILSNSLGFMLQPEVKIATSFLTIWLIGGNIHINLNDKTANAIHGWKMSLPPIIGLSMHLVSKRGWVLTRIYWISYLRLIRADWTNILLDFETKKAAVRRPEEGCKNKEKSVQQVWQQIGQPRTQMFVYYIHGATVSGRSRCCYLYYKCSGVVFLLSFWGVSCGGCFHFSFIRYNTIFNGNKHHHWWITVYASTVFMHRLCLFYPIKGIIWWIRRNFVPCICIFMQMSWRRFYVLCTYSTP